MIITENKLEKFMAQFPDNTTSWGEATDEIRDLANAVRCAYNGHVIDVVEGEPGYVEPVSPIHFSSAGEFNRLHKEQIRELWPQLTDHAKEEVSDFYADWF